MFKKLLLTALLMLVPSVYANDSTKSLSMKNQKAVGENVLTGGQPSQADFSILKENDVTTVINLRGIGEFDGFDEEKAASSSGLIYHALPISGAEGVTFENAEKLAQLIQQAEGKVLIHCASGNRAGALLALKSFSIDNMSVDDSMALGKQAGMTRLSKTVEAKLRQAKKNK